MQTALGARAVAVAGGSGSDSGRGQYQKQLRYVAPAGLERCGFL